MKQTIRILFITSFLLNQPARAQVVWQEGEITLSTGITIQAGLCFQPETNALLVRRVGKVRLYTAEQVRGFHYVEPATGFIYRYATYPVGPDATPFIFEERVHQGAVRLLQLAGRQPLRLAEQHGLPQLIDAAWQTPQPWYVWHKGQFITPDVFVSTGLADLLADSPKSARQWAANRPRPETPNALARWLTMFNSRLSLATGADYVAVKDIK